jgi:methionyl-tRNA synthetase
MAKTYLEHLNPEYLRYYYAAKLGAGVEDIDLSLADFAQRVNSDLVGKVVNIASRCAGFIKKAGGSLSDTVAEPAMLNDFQQAGSSIAQAYERREFSKAMREIMNLADRANEYIQAKAPWSMAKEEGREQEVHDVCSMGIHLFRLITLYLGPVLPDMNVKVQAFLNVESLNFTDRDTVLAGHAINKFKPLLTRIEMTQIDTLIEASKEDAAADAEKGKPKPVSTEAKPAGKDAKPAKEKPAKAATAETEQGAEIEFSDFAKLDLRVAKVVEADQVEGADKLLKLQLDVGESKTRQVFSGIKSHYTPEQLVGKNVVLVYNLKPRKMRFGLSEGMVLAAGGGDDLWVLESHQDASPGTRIT